VEPNDHQVLIEFLVGLGASAEDLREHAAELPGLASILALRLGRPTRTLADMAARAGLPIDVVTRRWRAAGFPDPGPDTPVVSEAESEVFAMLEGAERLFGREAVLQLTRVIGSATARIADAAVSTFLVNAELPRLGTAQAELAVARANAEAATLLPLLFRAIEVILRRHLLAARRSLLSVDRQAGVEVQQLAVGFVDLVGSTALGQQLSTAELGKALGEFESVVADTVTDLGGRVIKLIGDEVMYAAGDAAVACRIALGLGQALRAHRVLPPVRAGIASGAVMLRDGDCFGAVVNLAARAVKLARPGHIVVSGHVRAAVEGAFVCVPLPPARIKGFEGDIQLFELGG